ncbi:translation initiation factor IF-3-like [Haliotis rubra]|uniref:translation initiation factor IF-3-like n=1 Tax=Haliotis rubra TaxID=36100 RepID=UPI001EE596AE|nr:translation initiation factor IF-3-like [Haliotis rubra]
MAASMNRLAVTLCRYAQRKLYYHKLGPDPRLTMARSISHCPTEPDGAKHLLEQRLSYQLTCLVKLTRQLSGTCCCQAKKASVPQADLKVDSEVMVFDMTGMLIGKMSISQAEEMANKESLKLVDMGPNQDKVQCFKLMTGKELHKESMKTKSVKSGRTDEKEFVITVKITDHDLGIKLKHVQETLQKGRHVKITLKEKGRMEEAEVNRLQSQLLRKISDSVNEIAIVKNAVRTSKFCKVSIIPKEDAKQDV